MGNMKKKTWIWVLIFALIVLAGVAATVRISRSGGVWAVISVDGELVERVNLSKVRESRDLVVETAYGRNIVHIEQGAISVAEADCPDQICVYMGKLTTEGGMPIICMPHRLIIEIEDDGLDG